MSLSNNIQLLRKLSFKKLFNAFKVWASYHVSKSTKKSLSIGFPISMAIEPTTSCNLRCPECPSGLRQFTRPIGMLEPSFFKKTIDEVYQELIYLTFYFQGEPYLNPNFLDMVRYASDKGIYTSTSTNAQLLNSERAKELVLSGLDKLIVSMDGTTQEVYEQYRKGGKLIKAIEGVHNINNWKKELKSITPLVEIQFIVLKTNEHQMKEMKILAKSLKADRLVFKSAQLYDFENGNDLLTSIEKYSRYKKINEGSYKVKSALPNHCSRLWSAAVISSKGDLIPCCYDKDGTHSFGNLADRSFGSVWHNSKATEFRMSVLSNRKQHEMCRNCTGK